MKTTNTNKILSGLPSFYLCYAKSDIEQARELRNKLVADSFNVTLEEDITPGQNKRMSIDLVIENSWAIIICLSSNTIVEEGEIQYTIKKVAELSLEKPENTIFAIPAKLEACDMPRALSALQPANIFEENGYTNLVNSLNQVKTNMTNLQQVIQNAKTRINSSNNKLDFLLVGRSGVGKSSTINSLMGEEVSEVNPFEAQTQEILLFENEIEGVKYRVFDTPGFEDTNDDNRTRNILEKIQKTTSQIDCLIFVTPLGETRVRSDEQKSIELISEVFGSAVWKHSVIAFTFSNGNLPAPFNETYQKRTELLKKEILKFANKSVTGDVPSIAIDNQSSLIPNGEAWISNFYMTVLQRISDAGKTPFVLATIKRVENGEIPLSEEQVKEVIKSGFDIKGAIDITSLFAPSIGGAIGLIIGGTIAPFVGVGLGLAAFAAMLYKKEKEPSVAKLINHRLK